MCHLNRDLNETKKQDVKASGRKTFPAEVTESANKHSILGLSIYAHQLTLLRNSQLSFSVQSPANCVYEFFFVRTEALFGPFHTSSCSLTNILAPIYKGTLQVLEMMAVNKRQKSLSLSRASLWCDYLPHPSSAYTYWVFSMYKVLEIDKYISCPQQLWCCPLLYSCLFAKRKNRNKDILFD